MSSSPFPSFSSPPAPEFLSTTQNTATSPAPSQPSINGPSWLSPFPETTTNIDGGSRNVALTGLITGVVLGATFVLIGVCIFVCFYKRKQRKLKMKKKKDLEAILAPKDSIFFMKLSIPLFFFFFIESSNNLQQWGSSEIGHNLFTYEDLSKATSNFSNTNLIGQGGFGYVHRGVLVDGTLVAIKQLKAGSGQGEREFQAEIQTISRVHHRHLVSLLGYCITGAQRLLVYEFVPNKTLEFHLHEKGRPVMEWSKRMKIALGAAKGLAYLHEDCNPKTIHRDVKAANILIDDSYEAKLADFGLARSSLDTDTHVSTRIMGTFGYLAPEYASSGKLTDKSDVFSFGVVLLELITGRRPVDKSQPFADDDSLVDWAKPLMIQVLNGGNFDGLVDPRLENDFDINEMTRMVACAAASVRHSAKRRPKMSQIVRAFEGNISIDDLTEGAAPGHSTIYSLDGSSDYSSTQYKEDLKKFKKMALESQTFGSSECSGLTSDNGQNPSVSSSITEGQRTTQEIEPEMKTNETIS
ncbi:kinase family protein [Arabidopsis lyrata subsp. lyrata]|uniref:non-specific serine/threonine protein kinase n=1 Tax=Arabidopsis lyrata subsp. lyrata TaxID=81972 RepID=D7KIR2_ARALL|nr:kinase family protein [Arabidopsis lyrata subsp. lyrata]